MDDDISAYSGKRRPAYERMLEDVPRDASTRSSSGTSTGSTAAPSNSRNCSACARRSADRPAHRPRCVRPRNRRRDARRPAARRSRSQRERLKRRRGRRKMLEIAEAGLPHMGGTRPFGFLADRITHDPDEAQVIRQLADRALAGESLPSLGRWLDESDIRTVTGKHWRTPIIRGMLLSPRMSESASTAASRSGPAAWEPIITPEQGRGTAPHTHRPRATHQPNRAVATCCPACADAPSAERHGLRAPLRGAPLPLPLRASTSAAAGAWQSPLSPPSRS